jgi:hypothetical protein
MVPEFDETSKLDTDFSVFLGGVRRGVKQLGPKKAVPVIVGPVTMAYLTRFVSFGPGNEVFQ